MDTTQGNILILVVIGILLVLLFGDTRRIRYKEVPEDSTRPSPDSKSQLERGNTIHYPKTG